MFLYGDRYYLWATKQPKLGNKKGVKKCKSEKEEKNRRSTAQINFEVLSALN